jgi:hypothetical protein
MPTYEAMCRKCGKYHEYISSISRCYDTPECCGEKTVKSIFTAPVGYCENIHYQSPIDGRAITTKQARVEDLKRNGCRPWEGMEQEKKVAQERVKAEEKAFDARLEETAVGVYQSLPSESRQALEASV